MGRILIMSAKLATLGPLKIKTFWNKGYDIIISAHAGIFPSTFVPLVPWFKNSILDSVLKLNPVKRKKNQR